MEEKINILVLNNISWVILRYLAKNLSQIFKTAVRVSRNIIIPTTLLNEKKRQYEGRKFLRFLTENMTLGEVKSITLALFDRDIFTGNLDYVFGLASQFPKICIISLFRLHPHFEKSYFAERLKKKKTRKFILLVRKLSISEKTLYYERILKEAIHGIGHTLGLVHCDNRECIMYSSSTINDIDGKNTSFCQNCRKKL